MAYEFYLGKMLCPIAPSKVQTKINGKNKTITLMNEGEINILKQAGLTDISFDLLLPNVQYPFASYKEGFKNAKYFLDILEQMKVNKETFQFIVTRAFPNGRMLFDTNMKVSLEDYTIKEDKKEGFDMVVSVKLKQFRDYGTKILNVSEDNKASIQTNRPTDNSPAPKGNTTYTVKVDDTLFNISKSFYGDGMKYPVIFEANKGIIENPDLIHPGQVLTIPAI